MSEWGVPDWRDAQAYQADKERSFNRWRWEFLRRRDDLRAEFDAKAPIQYAKELELFRRFPEGSVELLRPDQPGFYVHTRLIGPDHEKYPDERLPNPRIGSQPELVIWWHDRLDAPRWYEGDQPDGHLRVDFDLSQPIGPQIDGVRRALKSLQSAAAKKPQHVEKWPTYLRVLDARADGASWDQIADLLRLEAPRSHEDPRRWRITRARDTHRAAIAMGFNFGPPFTIPRL